MNSAAAIIEALNARDAGSRMRQAARESWTQWLDRWAQRPGRVTGAPVGEVVDLLAAREALPPPARDVQLNRWQAFATLWRQHWHPASRDERRWRWTAGGVSLAWHVVIAILLLVVTALNFVPPRPVEEDAVQVEYIGRGTPAEDGGGPAPAPARTDTDASSDAGGSSSSAAASSTPAPSAPAVAAPESAPASPTVAAAPAEAPAAESPPQSTPQPVLLTTPVSAEPPTFTLPPTSVPTPTVEVVRAPAPQVQLRTIAEAARAPTVDVAAPRVDVERTTTAPSVTLRTIPTAPQATAPLAQLPAAVDVARSPSQAASVRARDIPMPAVATAGDGKSATPSPAAASGTAPGASAASAAGPGATAASSSSDGTGPRSSTTSGVGTGPKTSPAPGSWATAKRGDDWGDSSRERSGNGLFDGDGRPRLAEGPGSASAAHPPGMITQEIRDLDRAGTWLKRKPMPYEPTRWDRLWKPSQTLLDDWVDKGIKQVGIPIPGTNKKIICIVSILQLGGGCGITDPNLNEQPATARPPPDVPFKPGLQEGNGASWDTDGKAAPPPKLPGLFAPPKSGVSTDDSGG